MKAGKRMRKSGIIYLGIAALVILLNAAAWNSAAFSDWYIAYIFPIWVNTYGRITGLFPFSVGEFLLGAGVILAVAAAVFGLVWAGIGMAALLRFILRACRGKRRGRALLPEGKRFERIPSRGKFRGFTACYYRFFAWTFLIVCLIMTLNCFILYHASTFSEHYFEEDEGEYTLEELIGVYNMVAEKCNYFAGVIARDGEGMAVYEGGRGEKGELLDMADMAREQMKRLGEKYPQLDGYYPRPKALLSSDFMCQQYMQGYYFPFSMEANYNDVMHILNIPSTMCHELAHLRGYIYEDEANFIGYLACVESEDVFFQYAGYLSVLNYLNNDLYKARKETPAAYEKAVAAVVPVAVEPQVWTDNIFVTEEEWDRINGKALIDTDTVDKAADVFIDMNLKVNGVADGKVSYSRVVRLLLQYYRQAADFP